MHWARGRRPARGAAWMAVLVALVIAIPAAAAAAAAKRPAIRLATDQLAGPPLMGLGVQWDPYDSFRPKQADWDRTFQRVDFMHPGFIRVVEPAFDYFGGYDSAHNPTYRWNSRHLVQLRAILDYAKSRGITVVLGDWASPLIGGDARVPADFLAQLRNVYGYTNIRYYNLINEPNDLGSACTFGCWVQMTATLAHEFASSGVSRWLKLVGPDNANSWDDTPGAQALDRLSGLDTDNPIGGDSWVTYTLHAIPGLIGAYDSHRYGTIWGVENGVYQDQMRTRREQINNLDSSRKPYFGGEVGMTARQVNPLSALDGPRAAQLLAPLIDPSVAPRLSPFISPSLRVPRVTPFVDSQPHIREFAYGVWTADMLIQGIEAGMAGASAWDLDDAMHVGGQYGSQNLKQWGFWNSFGGHDGYPASDLKPRPWYYSWSVLARSFPAGSRVLTVPSTGLPGLRVAAAKVPTAGGYGLSLAVVNDSDVPRSITLSVPSVAGPLTLSRYDYFLGDRPTDATGLPVPARVIQGALLSTGVTVHLRSRGLVVLSSVGSGTSTALNDGTSLVHDDLSTWRKAYAHGGGLKLDHSRPADYNEDGSRVTSRSKRPQYLTYHTAANQLTSFKLKAYFRSRLGITAYGSADGNTWSPIALAATHPAPALAGGGWFLEELVPNDALPAGVSWLRIKLAPGATELAQVDIRGR